MFDKAIEMLKFIISKYFDSKDVQKQLLFQIEMLEKLNAIYSSVDVQDDAISQQMKVKIARKVLVNIDKIVDAIFDNTDNLITSTPFKMLPLQYQNEKKINYLA